MLRLLPDQVLIALSPSHISLARLRGWAGHYRIVKSDKHTLTHSKTDRTSWLAALVELRRCLSQPDWQNANAKIVISNTMAGYTLLPWSDVILNAVEELKLAQVKFAAIFGDDAENWEFSIAEGHFGQPRLACAISKEVLSSLRQLANTSKLNILSIQPHFVAAINYWQKQLQDKQLYFLMADEEKLLIALIQNGALQKIRSEQLSEPLTKDMLASSYQRELLLDDISADAAQAYIFAVKKIKFTYNEGSLQHLKSLYSPDNYMYRPDAFLTAAC